MTFFLIAYLFTKRTSGLNNMRVEMAYGKVKAFKLSLKLHTPSSYLTAKQKIHNAFDDCQNIGDALICLKKKNKNNIHTRLLQFITIYLMI